MRRTAAFILRPDPGWLFVLAGLAICTSAVLIPARQNLHELRQSLAGLQAEEAHASARLKAYSEFLDDLERDDPQMIRRLAASQLNLVPAGDEPVLLATSNSPTITDWIDCTVPVREVHTTPWPDSLLTRLTGGPHRRWLFAGGGLCVFIGLLMAPTEIRRRSGHGDRQSRAGRTARLGVKAAIPAWRPRGERPAIDGPDWEDALPDLPPCRAELPDDVEVIIDTSPLAPVARRQPSIASPEPVDHDGLGELAAIADAALEADEDRSEPQAQPFPPDREAATPAAPLLHAPAEATLFDDLLTDGQAARDDAQASATASPAQEQSAGTTEADQTTEASALAVAEAEAPVEAEISLDSTAEVEEAEEAPTADVDDAAEDEEDEEEQEDEEWEYVYEDEDEDEEEGDEEEEEDADDEYEYVYEYEYVDEVPDDDDEYEIVEECEEEEEEDARSKQD